MNRPRTSTTSKSNTEEAFASLKSKWWWFDHKLNAEHGMKPEAWDWEILRRTQAYQDFHAAASAVPKPPVPSMPPPGTGLGKSVGLIFGPRTIYRQRIVALVEPPPLGDLDPRRHWPELFLSEDTCPPDLSWPELSAESQAKLHLDHNLFPGQDVPIRKFQFFVTGATVNRITTGAEELLAYSTDAALSNYADTEEIYRSITLKPIETVGGIVNGKHPAFTILPVFVMRLDYVVIEFDARAGESVLSQLDDWKEIEIGTKNDGTYETYENYPLWWRKYLSQLEFLRSEIPPKKRFSKVIPSKQHYRVQAWIPIFDRFTGFGEVRKRFRTLIGARDRKRWLPQCKEAWSMPETIELWGQRREVTYGSYQEPGANLKAKSGRHWKDIYQFGMPAFDVRNSGVECRFTTGGMLRPYLLRFRSGLDRKVLHDYFRAISDRIKRIDGTYAGPHRP